MIKENEKNNSHKGTKTQRLTKKIDKNPWCPGAFEAKKIKKEV